MKNTSLEKASANALFFFSASQEQFKQMYMRSSYVSFEFFHAKFILPCSSQPPITTAMDDYLVLNL